MRRSESTKTHTKVSQSLRRGSIGRVDQYRKLCVSNPSLNLASRYRFLEMIGKGTFGKVYSAVEVQTQNRVAVKVVELFGNYKNRQLDIFQRIKHPNCIELQKHFVGYNSQTKNKENYQFTLYLVMEQLDFSLAKYVQVRRKRPPFVFLQAQIKVICFQLFKALDYLDGLQICHRDLKPQNILINRQTLQVKICDFGSAKIIQQGEENLSYICSRYYRAPELLFGYKMYSSAVDCWSVGCIMLELLTGQPVFPGDSTIDQIIEIIKILGNPPKCFFEEVVNMDTRDLNLPRIETMQFDRVFGRYKQSPLYLDLAKRCLSFDWRARLKPHQAFLHPFFGDLKSKKYDQYTTKLPSLFDFTLNLTKYSPEQKSQIESNFKCRSANKENVPTPHD